MTTRSRITVFLAAALMAASAAAAAAGAITDVRFQNTGAAQSQVPVTFGQVFAVGDVKKADVLVGTLDGATVPLQVDVKATHADGSVRHAIISAIVPTLAAGRTGRMTLATGGRAVAGAATPADLLATGFTASASVTIAGVRYTASADQLLKAGVKATWLAGAVAREWHVSAPLATAAGVAHPHLHARFAIRYYPAVKKTRVDVTVENAWAYEPGPQNVTYDAEVQVAGKTVYAKTALKHLHHARWRKLFWHGAAPAVNVQSNVPYLIASRAVPNYDQAPGVAESLLASLAAGSTVEPMGIGPATAYMPTTGAHADIGILPQWGAAWVLTMDSRARDATLAAGIGAGSFSMHYRDRATDRPVALADHPRMTVLGRSTDAGADAFPGCGGDCATPYTPDTSHQPSFAYLPYLVTGDYFYLEEMQFWAMWDAFNDNPNYRGGGKGLLQSGQVRGQAWGLRTLAQAAYITPDADPLKDDFNAIVDNNLDWYNDTYTRGGANSLGVITSGYAFSYQGNTAVAPWQDDFFTAAVGHAAELGFAKAGPLLKWKAKFAAGRMVAPGFCWIDAALYNVKLRDTAASPIYTTLAEVYRNSVDPKLASLKCNSSEQLAYRNAIRRSDERTPFTLNDMPGYATSNVGYPSNFQPALALAVDSGYTGGAQAWTAFANRAVRPDYRTAPQFSILPRTVTAVIRAPVRSAPKAPVASALLATAPTAAGTWVRIASEGAAFIVPADTFVRYGAGSAWIYAKGSGTASNAFFGRDPAVNIVKAVEAFTPTAP